MFDLLTLKNYNDFFKPQSQRTVKGVYFYRFIGYDKDILSFLQAYFIEAERLGTYINEGLVNPTESEVKYFYNVTDENFSLSLDYISNNAKKWLLGIPDENLSVLSQSIYDLLQFMQNCGVNINIIKNSYIKFMCWIKMYFIKPVFALGSENIPKILFEGDINKYELYMLRILSKSGCDIVYVNLNEDSYLKYDKDSIFSSPVYGKEKKIPVVHFTDTNISNIKEETKKENDASKFKSIENIINTNNWIKGEVFENIFLKNNERNIDKNKINNIFAGYIGVKDEDEYNRFLYNLNNDLIKSDKPYILIDTKMHNPTVDEVNSVNKAELGDKEKILNGLSNILMTQINNKVNLFFKKAFIEAVTTEEFKNLAAFRNFALKMLIWIIRYCKDLFNNFDFTNIPIMIYYGNASEQETLFLKMIAKTPIDILYFCSDKEKENHFLNLKNHSEVLLKEFENTRKIEDFPKNELKITASTVAYNAESELKTLIYTDTGLYKERQFSRSKPITLKTAYDEIFIIWKEEAKYRPHFNVNENVVNVPNIFAKVCGVENGNISEYFKKIRTMITNDTILITKFPFISDKTENEIKPFVYKFLENKKIKINDIKKHNKYAYDFLSDEKQDYILEKIQELINLDLIAANTMGIENAVLSTLLNLDSRTLRLIQQFDFTKNIPKLIIIDTDETTASLEDSIYISFLNLIGFDIAVFTPTGYRNIEKHISEDAFQKYDIGDLIFDIIPPNENWFYAKDNFEKGFLNRLFGKGRK